MSFDDTLSPLKIALWGPPGSGKTCLVRALAQLPREYKDPCLDFILEDDTRTTNLESNHHYWRVGRRQKEFNHTSGYDQARVGVSVYQHRLDLYDPPGSQEFLRNSFANTFYTTAHLVIVLLDFTQLTEPETGVSTPKAPLPTVPSNDNEIDLSDFVRQSIFFRETTLEVEPPPAQANMGIPKNQYVQQVKGLLESLSYGLYGQNPHVAVCITKVDRIMDEARGEVEPEGLLREKFGQEMLSALSQTQNPNIRLYAVSACGYQRVRASEPPEDPASWQPINIEGPLFDLLEERERRLLENSRGFLENLLFRRENLGQYIPYRKEGRS